MSFLEVMAVGRQLNDTWIVNAVSFHQHKLQNIAIAGETGSGKSTLLKMVAGLAQPQTGQVLFEGIRVEGPAEKLIPGHPGIGYLSQVFELPKFLRVEQVLQYASKMDADEARQLFEICRINHLLKRRTDELSGGEQQRIALARLLVMRPKLLLLDEPFSNLDLIHKNILKGVLQAVQAQLQLSYILTSHDPQDTLTWADTIGIMKAGEIIQWGKPEEVYRKPANEYVAGLLGKYVLLDEQIVALPTDQSFRKGVKWIARPDAFQVKKIMDNRGDAQVAAIRFAGAYYELDIQLKNRLLTIYTNDKNWRIGDKAKLSLSPADVWQLND